MAAKVTVTEQTVDNASTGDVEYAAPGETRAEHYGQPVVVDTPTPGPVTMTVSWKSEAQAKVVKVDDEPAPKKSRTASTKA